MDYLRNLAYEGEGLPVLELTRDAPSVRGVAADLDAFWLLGWRLANALPWRDFQSWDRMLSIGLPGTPWSYPDFQPASWWRTATEAIAETPFLTPPIDLAFSFDAWNRLSDMRGIDSDPRMMRVVLHPGARYEEAAPLRELLADLPIQVAVETRPVARAYASGNDRVRPLVGGIGVGAPGRPPGTLGGVLEGGDGARYALTCSHVLASGEPAEQPAGCDAPDEADRIGECVASTTLVSAPPCNPAAGSDSPVDAALIRIDEQVESRLGLDAIGPLTGQMAASELDTGMVVEVVGKRSGHRQLRVGGLFLSNTLSVQGEKCCYTETFELKPLSAQWPITGIFSPPVRDGDSGAWVVAPGESGTEWCGVVVGGDGPVGYASFSERVSGWLAEAGYPDLRVA